MPRHGGKLSDRRGRHDAFYRKAKNEGFAARAVYKLEDLDSRFALVRAGDRVLDLGCWPGSWLQYLERKVGPRGRVVGLDRADVKLHVGPTVRIEQGDVRTFEVARLLGDLQAFDVVVSDLAPDTTGIRITDQARSAELFSCALTIALGVLRPGGHFVGKIFQGPDVQTVRAEMAKQFSNVREVKPDASRKQSLERYLIGLAKR